MLFTKYTSFFALPLLAVATPWATPTTTPAITTTVTVTSTATATEPASDCSTSSIQCCNSTEPAGSTSGAALLDLLGVAVQDANVIIGVDCTPISAVGVGSGSCSAAPVCCEDNNFNGAVAVGCVPVDLSL